MGDLRIVGTVVAFNRKTVLVSVVGSELASFYDKLGKSLYVEKCTGSPNAKEGITKIDSDPDVRRTIFIDSFTDPDAVPDGMQVGELVHAGPGRPAAYLGGLANELGSIFSSSIGLFSHLFKCKFNGHKVTVILTGIYVCDGFKVTDSGTRDIIADGVGDEDINFMGVEKIQSLMANSNVVKLRQVFALDFVPENAGQSAAVQQLSAFDDMVLRDVTAYIQQSANSKHAEQHMQERALASVCIKSFLNYESSAERRTTNEITSTAASKRSVSKSDVDKRVSEVDSRSGVDVGQKSVLMSTEPKLDKPNEGKSVNGASKGEEKPSPLTDETKENNPKNVEAVANNVGVNSRPGVRHNERGEEIVHVYCNTDRLYRGLAASSVSTAYSDSFDRLTGDTVGVIETVNLFDGVNNPSGGPADLALCINVVDEDGLRDKNASKIKSSKRCFGVPIKHVDSLANAYAELCEVVYGAYVPVSVRNALSGTSRGTDEPDKKKSGRRGKRAT